MPKLSQEIPAAESTTTPVKGGFSPQKDKVEKKPKKPSPKIAAQQSKADRQRVENIRKAQQNVFLSEERRKKEEAAAAERERQRELEKQKKEAEARRLNAASAAQQDSANGWKPVTVQRKGNRNKEVPLEQQSARAVTAQQPPKREKRKDNKQVPVEQPPEQTEKKSSGKDNAERKTQQHHQVVVAREVTRPTSTPTNVVSPHETGRPHKKESQQATPSELPQTTTIERAVDPLIKEIVSNDASPLETSSSSSANAPENSSVSIEETQLTAEIPTPPSSTNGEISNNLSGNQQTSVLPAPFHHAAPYRSRELCFLDDEEGLIDYIGSVDTTSAIQVLGDTLKAVNAQLNNLSLPQQFIENPIAFVNECNRLMSYRNFLVNQLVQVMPQEMMW